MDFWELGAILLRRWYAFMPILLATVGLTFLLTETPETVYHAQATVLVTSIPAEVAGMNPYARDEATAQTMATVMSSPEARARVVTGGGSELFTVTLAAERSALLLVQGSAGQDTEALATTDTVVATMQERLQELQTEAGVKPRAPRSRVVVVSPPSMIEPETGSRIRELGVGFAVGGLFGVAFALAIEGLARRRAKKRARSAEAAEEAQSAEAAEPAQSVESAEATESAEGSAAAEGSADPERELLSR